MVKQIKFKVDSLRTLTSPYKRTDKDETSLETIYYLLINMKDLPDDIPMDVNPRVPKMGTNVAKRLIKAVVEPETDFYINNRGIIIAAKSLSFNSAESEVTIDIGNQDDENDKFNYGILDGGHTYTAIIQNRDKIPKDIEKFVRMEVITNVVNITRLSDARNTSVQVSDIALFNLEDSFEDVRRAIQEQPYADKIAYKDNENKPISISELLRLMYAFDVEKYPDDNIAPIQSYSGKAQVFKRYRDAFKSVFYKSLTKQLPKLVDLYDLIEREVGDKYVEYKKNLGVSIPRFGAVKGVESVEKGTKTEFLENKTYYSVSSGYIYPIFGAFRSLLKIDEETGKVYWLYDPIEIWGEVGTSIVQNTFETSSNPQLAGKDKQLWLSNYRIVETQSLRKLLKARR
ncbi:AIPR family protein [Mediterraneibacter glycyrrhizinilyticus]|uniref:AIPR family protein n=1 Tax=Mediterraneibacter glycyrrhizinilyticus TaxID=342942 RepID=UPI0025A3414F|nr:AIPR family protein [Mediterraneibacter glycyrrhizinilyticus]MDM8212179.1 AIPR family protein [Mediterraneibacter glycyrrhizinilyticus]